MAQRQRLLIDGAASVGAGGAAGVEPSVEEAAPSLDVDRLVVRLGPVGPASASWIERGCKRALDIVISAFALVVLLPFTMIAVIAIVLDSRGSPIFVHDRIGRVGAPFGVLKLRTMQADAQERLDAFLKAHEELHQQLKMGFKLLDDPRVTRVGAFLRRWSLDEIPQFLNVLLGQMSVVGPRPVTPDEASFFGSDLPLVLSVRPGLTGLWAVSGRSELPYRERAALEASYVRSWSLRGDLSIIVRTVPAVMSRRGAC